MHTSTPGDTSDSNKELLDRTPAFAPGSPEEQYLRNRSSYIAPTGTDKLYLAYRIVLGVLINFVFLALPLFGLAMILGSAVYSTAFRHLAGACRHGCTASPPIYMWIPPATVAGLSVAFGGWALVARSLSDRRARFLQLWSTRLLLISAGVAWLMIALPAVVALFTAGHSTGPSPKTTGIVGGGGLLGVLLGVAANLREAVATPSKAIDEAKKAKRWFASLNSTARRWVAYTVGALVGPAMLLGAMVLGSAIALRHTRHGSVGFGYVVGGTGALVVFAVGYRLADMTSWSLHPFYKRRLCTAFALKRVKPSELPDDSDERPLDGIEQDKEQGIASEREFGRPVKLSQTGVGGDWPALLVCAAANVSDPAATPPGRGVTSFTFSANEIGGPLIGGVLTTEYEGALIGTKKNGQPPKPKETVRNRRVRNCTLPAAVAMSGAALAPSIGKMTR
ncbi:MAG: hypothetical protein ABSG43_15285 [Solirubrobacteraceae bacterium]